MEDYNIWLRRAESEMREELREKVKIKFPKPRYYDLSAAPTWALIEELKKRPGVTFRANTTKEGLVGTFEHAPAVVFTVKLPLEK